MQWHVRYNETMKKGDLGFVYETTNEGDLGFLYYFDLAFGV